MQYESKVVQIQNGATISVPATFVNAHGRRPNAFHIKEQKCLFQNEEEKVVQKKKRRKKKKTFLTKLRPKTFTRLYRPSSYIVRHIHSLLVTYDVPSFLLSFVYFFIFFKISK